MHVEKEICKFQVFAFIQKNVENSYIYHLCNTYQAICERYKYSYKDFKVR